MKNKSILVDYLNLYTIIYIVFYQYKSVSLLYRHKFLDNIYTYFLKLLSVEIRCLNIHYSSFDHNNYCDIANEKDYLTNQDFVGKKILPNYLYKKYFYERIHPIVELKVFFGHLNFEKILINYGDYFSLLEKEGFYKKVKYYFLPSFSESINGVYFFNYVYIKKKNLLFRTYITSVLKILRFSFSYRTPSTTNVLVASQFKKSFINDSLYSFDKSEIEYVVIDPTTSILYSNEGKKINHLYSINFTKIFETIKGIYRIYSEFSIKNSRSLSLNLHILGQSKDIFFLKKTIKDLNVKVVYTCYEGSPIINTLNLLGYSSDKFISLCSTWSLGYIPQFIDETYKGCDIFFSWGEKQNNSYLRCKSPFRSLIKVGYIGDYAINFMKNKPNDEIQELKNKGYKIIAVYDNVAAFDFLITYTQLNNFYKGLLNLLKEGSFACVIKNKRIRPLYNYIDKNLVDEILSYSDKVIIMGEKCDLSPAFDSDFLYSLSLSGLGSVASIWGKKTIFYDESGFIDKNQISVNGLIINNIEELIPSLKLIEKDSCLIDKNSFIDPFVDGNAQNRIVEYINLLLSLTEKSKFDMIRESNIIYKKKYGNDKVLINELYS